ncbi:transglutaminase domain-containing protein [Haloferula sp.]|uniref:transglutaminase domain-containing protein n=1 Tax=Haloferula sp. TaxID=2497595 RepID=UPI003C78E58D
MRSAITCLFITGIAISAASDGLVDYAAGKHGDFGEKAARFLVEHMPEQDRGTLDESFLRENLDLALEARSRFPWAKEVPDEIFFNDVLPYAVLDETRDPWRADFLAMATPMVKDAKTATEAVQILNRDFFKRIKTHYHQQRRKPNQSPKESIEQGRATCTGLSIILVDACRAIGIPARAVGTPMWSNGRGNHTWVEIWDGDWHFTGADEYVAEGLNRGWFTGDAGKADANNPLHAIYASSWKRDGLSFPLVWAPENQQVGAVNVTHRYAEQGPQENFLGLRFFHDGERQQVPGLLIAEDGTTQSFITKAGTSDLNDMPRLKVNPQENYRLRLLVLDEFLEAKPFTASVGESTLDMNKAELEAVAADRALTEEDAAELVELVQLEFVAREQVARQLELKEKSITHDNKTLKWLEKTFGEAPNDGRSLWISMHGGGGAPARVNDQQWKNQIQLYQPEEGIYVAPRAPTDTWNLWHEAHIDPLFDRLIENMIALRGVNPDKVYLMGYSAGGDGVWQLAPRMADRFAAASMMAGHPNESSLLGLRNLPFAIFMGGADSAYDRNKIAAQKSAELEKLHQADPTGYTHLTRIYEGLPHWMNRKDAEALPWMAQFTRNPWPEKIVWFQDDVTHERLYWLQLPKGTAEKGQQFHASVEAQTITLEGPFPKGTQLLLHDSFIDLDQPIFVKLNDQDPQRHEVHRSIEVIRESLSDRLDPRSCPTASITLD